LLKPTACVRHLPFPGTRLGMGVPYDDDDRPFTITLHKNSKLKKSEPLNSPQSANETLKLFP
jgi:hypothetical protein